jgi:thymidylate synthase
MDMFLGAPYNIASYGILLHLVAKIAKMKIGKLIFQVGDYHIYNNHSEQVVEILNRYAKKFVGISDYSEKFPKLEILADKLVIEDYEMEDFKNLLVYDDKHKIEDIKHITKAQKPDAIFIDFVQNIEGL